MQKHWEKVSGQGNTVSTPATEKRQGEPMREREKGDDAGGLHHDAEAWRSDVKAELE